MTHDPELESQRKRSAHKLGRIICLSNVFDEQYHDLRGEPIDRCLSSAKRRDLFRCLELATGRKIILLSSPPKALERRRPRWLAPVETRFSTHQQFFCANWDAPKVRVPLSWFFYARQAMRRIQSGDLVLLDNYEFIYVVAALLVRCCRQVTFILDYEDGKHLIDQSWWAVLSRAAEALGRRIIRASILAHPRLGERLPRGVPSEIVPGFVAANAPPPRIYAAPVRFLYSGSLDSTRGVDLLLAALPALPAEGWRLEITGAGPLADHVAATANDLRWQNRVTFHGSLPASEYSALVERCHVGLNCQRASDPISGVTFPSKIFFYLSAGLNIVSSRASDVDKICGQACVYYDEETPEALSAAMQQLMRGDDSSENKEAVQQLHDRYSIAGTAERLRRLLGKINAV